MLPPTVVTLVRKLTWLPITMTFEVPLEAYCGIVIGATPSFISKYFCPLVVVLSENEIDCFCWVARHWPYIGKFSSPHFLRDFAVAHSLKSRLYFATVNPGHEKAEVSGADVLLGLLPLL